MSRLVDDLIRSGNLRSDNIIDAFLKIGREKFVPSDLLGRAEANMPLPIGNGQTISQPLTVAFMFELLVPKEGQNILDVGSGSGWTTGLLSHIVGKSGKVTAIELIENLCKQGEKNVGHFGFVKSGIAEFHCQSGEFGFEKNAPYDRILVSAAVQEVPEKLKQQLAISGRMVLPVKNEIWCMEKKSENDFEIEKFPGFTFVPFVK
ncbi:MAG: protein-L-isoaspartate O-methyltransferase [Candidatus Moranbacteria bacterium]|nr:protein-L-isoaspartate O-methyltransferase [Candidatus Moranbacteria bacterium]